MRAMGSLACSASSVDRRDGEALDRNASVMTDEEPAATLFEAVVAVAPADDLFYVGVSQCLRLSS